MHLLQGAVNGVTVDPSICSVKLAAAMDNVACFRKLILFRLFILETLETCFEQ